MRAGDPEEGLDHAIARHRLHGAAMLAGIRGMGLAVFGDVEHRMNNVLGVMIPPQVQGEQVRQMMLNDFGIEIGTSFGPLQGKIWRIGTMGYNARKDCVLQTGGAGGGAEPPRFRQQAGRSVAGCPERL